MATRKLVSKHVNVASGDYIGRDGELWVDTVSNLLKISDGATPGGVVVTTDGGDGITWAAITDINNAAGPDTVAIGRNAGSVTQGTESVAIGDEAGKTSQGNNAVAVGNNAGETSQGTSAVSIGDLAGNATQSGYAVAIGASAGQTTQGISATAVGNAAGYTGQGESAVAIGHLAGQTTQSTLAVAVGFWAGNATQGAAAVAIGPDAGSVTQGNYAIAIGSGAGETNQAAKSIVINATGAALNNIVEDVFIVKPVREGVGTSILQYDASTGEITHTNDIYSDQQVSITVSGEDSTEKTWYFGNDGNLTFPDGTNQSTAWTGIPGPYADDAAAASAGVAVGYPYHKTGTGGQVFVRLS